MISIVIGRTEHQRAEDIVDARNATGLADVAGKKSIVPQDEQDAALHYQQAAVSLIHWSQLARFIQVPATSRFEAVPKSQFDNFWQTEQPNFGPLICWVIFSVGAEYLAKAACLKNGVLHPKPDKFPIVPPNGPVDDWATAVCQGATPKGQVRKNYGDLGALCGSYSDSVSSKAALYRLDVAAQLDTKRTKRMIAAYRLLADAIRNRDLHMYQQSVRDKDFDLVANLFVPAFNEVLTLYFNPLTAQTL